MTNVPYWWKLVSEETGNSEYGNSELSSQVFCRYKIVLKKNKVYLKRLLCNTARQIMEASRRKVWDETNCNHTDIFQESVCHSALCWLSAQVAAGKGLEFVLSLWHIWQKFPSLAAGKTGRGALEQSWTCKLSRLGFLYAAGASDETNSWIFLRRACTTFLLAKPSFHNYRMIPKAQSSLNAFDAQKDSVK